MLKDAQCAASIPASDIDRARQWYADKLGLEPTQEGPGGLGYELSNGTGFFLYPSAFAGTNQATAMGFVISDFDSEFDELKARGVEFEDYDFGEELRTEGGVAKMPDGNRGAWFKDSEGNILSISTM